MIVFDDKLEINSIVFNNEGYRKVIADIIALQISMVDPEDATNKLRKFDNCQSLDLYGKTGKAPLLKEVKFEPTFPYFYLVKDDLKIRLIPLNKITEDQKKQSLEVYTEYHFSSNKNKHIQDKEYLKQEAKRGFNKYVEQNEKGIDYLDRPINPTDSQYFLGDKNGSRDLELDYLPIPLKKLFGYCNDAFDKYAAKVLVRDILKKAVIFYRTEKTGGFIPQVGTFVEKHWNLKEADWTKSFNDFLNSSLYYNAFRSKLKIKDIKEKLDLEPESLIKFQSFIANLSEYIPQVNVDLTDIRYDVSGNKSTQETSAPVVPQSKPVVSIDDKVVQTEGISEIIFQKVRPYISRDPVLSQDDNFRFPDFGYKLSADKKEIVYTIDNLETSQDSKSFKSYIEKAFTSQEWVKLMALKVEIFEGDMEELPMFLFTLRIKVSLIVQGYIFHEYGKTVKSDIKTKEPKAPTLKIPSRLQGLLSDKIDKDKLIPPSEYSLDDKIRFVLKFKPDFGTCAFCGGQYALKADGTLVSHGFKKETVFQRWQEKKYGTDCPGWGRYPLEFSKEPLIFKIEDLSLELHKLKKSSLPSDKATQEYIISIENELKNLQIKEDRWKFQCYDPGYGLWFGAQYPTSSGNLDYVTDDLTSQITDVILKLGNFKAIFTDKLEEKTLNIIGNAFSIAVDKIKKSPLKDFKKVLRGRVFIGLRKTLVKRLISMGEQNVAAFYNYTKGFICLHIDDRIIDDPTMSIVHSIIHEFGHKFHNEELKGFYNNPELKALFNIDKSENCVKAYLPRKGDLLKDFLLDWTVKLGSSDDHRLVQILGTKLQGAKYVFENSEGDRKILPEEELLTSVVCPSQYGSEDVTEWFAEMCALVTAGRGRAPQEQIIKKFIKIVNENS